MSKVTKLAVSSRNQSPFTKLIFKNSGPKTGAFRALSNIYNGAFCKNS